MPITSELLAVQLTWTNVETYASDSTGTPSTYERSIPANMAGIMSTTTDLVSHWVVLSTGSIFSAEWTTVSTTKPTLRMYSHSTQLCWQTIYSSSTGYSATSTNQWTQTSTGPLGVACSSVTSASWYTTAQGLSNGATSTTVSTISSGYIGITYMKHESSQNAVFGAELDGRTLSNELTLGKPSLGSVYIV